MAADTLAIELKSAYIADCIALLRGVGIYLELSGTSAHQFYLVFKFTFPALDHSFLLQDCIVPCFDKTSAEPVQRIGAQISEGNDESDVRYSEVFLTVLVSTISIDIISIFRAMLTRPHHSFDEYLPVVRLALL